ncbi:MAG TPA: dTMP kinase [Campylobacterales bacterium]|nr:dTMP kinase [Campylobacterales bacterium]
MYVVFEGVDTSGKSTQVDLLRAHYPDAIKTKEPGGTDLGMTLRELILHQGVNNHKTELFLFLADRAEHSKNVIEHYHDKMIISDRGLISGIAYALANHESYEMDFLITLNRFALDEKMPDKVILLLTNEALIKERMGEKNEDMIEKRGIAYLLKIQAIMIDVLEALKIDYITLDASKSKEVLHQEIKGFVS